MTNTKPCFLLIRGLLREQRHWGEFKHILQQQFPLADIISLDIPGNGRLYKQNSPNNIAAYTDSLRSQLGRKSAINLIALSMGGMIALDWMNRYPAEISSAVLVNTSMRPYSAFYHRLRWQRYPAVFSLLTLPPEQIEQQILSLTSNTYNNKTELLKQWLLWRKQNPVSKTSALNQLLAAARFSNPNKPLHPILILSSKNDHLVNPCCSQALHDSWHCDFQQHDTAGHDLALDEPQWLAQTIFQWQKSV